MKRTLLLSLACAMTLASANADDIVLCNFEGNAVGDAYTMKDIYNPSTTSVAVVADDPVTPGNKVLHVTNTSWNTFVEYALPEGITGANMLDKYQTITFDIYRPSTDGNDWMQMAILLGSDQLYWDSDYPYQGDRGMWHTKTYDLKEVKNDAQFLYIGFNNNTAEYYIDNIRLSGVTKQETDTLRWTGATSDVWDNGVSANFAHFTDDVDSVAPVVFANGNRVVFDDTVKTVPSSKTVNVKVSGSVEAPNVVFNNKSLDYVLTAADASSAITGFGRMSILGGGSVTTSVENRLNGGTYIADGTLKLGNAATPSAFGTSLAVDSASLHFCLNTSDYVSVDAPITVSAGGTLNAYMSRYTYWMSNLSGNGTVNIYAGGERAYLGNAKGAKYPDWTAFTGTVNLYAYKDVFGSAGFYGLVLGHGGKTFNPEEAQESIESGKVNDIFANKTLVMHEGTTLASESGTRGFRIGELRMSPTSRICGYYKANNPKSYYLVGCLNTDSELDGQIAPVDKNGKPYESQQVGLLKEGTGTYTLTNNNNLINGGIRVLDGTLLVNNDAAAAKASKLTGGTGYVSEGTQTFVFQKAAIGGTGNIAGNTDVYGTLEPGNGGVGTLTFANYAKNTPVNLYLRPTTVINMEVADTDSVDRIIVTGDLIYYNICEDFTESEATPTIKIDVKDSYKYREGDEFVLIEAAGKGSLYGDPWNFNVVVPDDTKWTVEEQETATGYRLVLKTNLPNSIESAAEANDADIYAEGGNIYVNTTAGTVIRIYNAAGALLSETIAHEGLNTISGINGMVIVNAGDMTKKINNK